MLDRFLTTASGSLVDHSYQIANYHSDSVSLPVDSGEYIYIGSKYPFNTKYFKFTSPNIAAASMVVEYWDGSEFRAVVETLDETEDSGIPLSKDGRVMWVPDRDHVWQRDDTENIPELSSVTIYETYWLRISFSASISADLKWLGRKFAVTEDLRAEHRDLLRTNVLNAFQSGKTDYEDEIVRASDILTEDLISKQIISSKNQLLDSRRLNLACVSKLAEIIYGQMGDDYIDKTERARSEYNDRVSNNLFSVDINNDAREQTQESSYRAGRLSR